MTEHASCPDLWMWRAEYTDGTALDEYDARGDHGVHEIDQSRLQRFVLVPQVAHLQAHALIPHEAQLIFFRHRRIALGVDGEEVGRQTVHVLGLRRAVDGTDVTSLVHLFADGSLALSDHDLLTESP